MMTTTLKLRADLQSAEVVDADGVLYYDVTDPRTGGVLRLFDFEWLIAQKLDGQRSYDELAKWSEEQLGLASTRDDLQVYAERLQQLGLVDGAVVAGKPLPAALYAAAALKVLGAVPGSAKPVVAPPEPVLPAVPAPAAAVAPAPAPAPISAPIAAPTPAPAKAVSRPPAGAARPLERPSEPMDRRASRDEDALMGQQILPTRPSPLAHPQRPIATTPAPIAAPAPVAPVVAPAPVAPVVAPAPVAPVIAPAPVAVTPAVVAPISAPAAPPAEPELPSAPLPAITRQKSDMLAAIESLPPPVEEPAPPAEVKSAPVQMVQPPVSQPEPIAAPAAPAALVEPRREPSAPTPAPQPIQIPIEPVPMARPAEPSKPAETAVERPIAPAPEPSRPAQPISPQPMVQERPAAMAPPIAVKPTEPVEKPSGAGKWFVILVIVAVLAVVAYYFLALRPPASQPAVGVSISIAKPEDVTRSFTPAAVVKKAEPQPLTIDSDGTVTKVVDENTEVQPDTVLVELDAQTKFAKELTELRERLAFYQKKLDSPKVKSKPDQLRDAQQKVAEKQQRLDQVEALIKKSQLMAPRAGQVSRVMVKVGQSVTAGTEVVSITDKALAAEIKIPAIEAQGMKVGQDAQLAGSSGALTARVAALRTEGDYALVKYTLPENAAAKPGDELKLQKAPLSQVVRLPNSVLVEGSKVFVLRDGKATMVKVTVADRDGDAVLLQGLPSGEQVITNRLNELHEGTAVHASMPGAQ